MNGPKPFRVERWFLWSDGELRTWSQDYATEKDARTAFDSAKELVATTRVRLVRRGPSKNRTVLSVWSR